jgi:hypothetical protein
VNGDDADVPRRIRWGLLLDSIVCALAGVTIGLLAIELLDRGKRPPLPPPVRPVPPDPPDPQPDPPPPWPSTAPPPVLAVPVPIRRPASRRRTATADMDDVAEPDE